MVTTQPFSAKIFPKDPAVRTIIVYNLLQGAYLGYIQIFWQPWLITLGMSIAVIGVLEAVAGRSGILSGLMQVIGGKYSDRIGRQKLILLGSAFLISCWTTAAIAIAIVNENLVYVAYILWGLGILSVPVFDATLADHVESRDRSRIYSIVLVANFIPGSVSGFLVGAGGDHYAAWTLLFLAAAIEASGFILILWGIKDNPQPVIKYKTAGFRIRETLSKIKQHGRYFSVFMMDTIGWSISTSILFALLSARGFTSFEFGLIALSQPIGIVFGTLPGGWLTHRIGARQLLTSSEVLGAAMVFGWAFYPIEPLIVLYGFIWGFAISTWAPVQFHLSTMTFREESRGEMLGALGTSLYFVRIFGPIIAAGLYFTIGYSTPLIAGGLVMIATIMLIWKFLPAESRAELEEEMSKV